MKKLFTLIALMACFLSAKAVTVVDAEVDYSTATEVKFFGWGGSESARARLSIQDGCLHFHSEVATDPTWDCQFHPIGGVNAEIGVTYTLHYKIKGTVAQGCSMLGFGQTPYGQFQITTDWVEGTVDYECTDQNGGNLLMQCGDYVGDWDIAYLKITHEEREQRPVTWLNMLTNGDASGEYGEIACVQTKEFGMNIGDDGQPAIHNAEIVELDGNKVFVCHAQAVNPPLTWDSDGEQWGTPHSAGDPMPDNAWQNQVWLTLPRALKDGEQYKVSFKYKASKEVNTSTQNHRLPGDYLDGGQLGDVKFTTEWQTYEKIASASAGMQSIAFNLGQEIYSEDIDFYFDDVEIAEMQLDHGFFVAAANTKNGTDYDFDNATEFVYDEEMGAISATVGKAGDPDSWVNEIMISTVRGNDKAFKSATIKASLVNEQWKDYTEASNAKLKLPAAGVWTIYVDSSSVRQIVVVQVEGDSPKDPIIVTPNPTHVVVNAVEREYTTGDNGDAPEGYVFQKDENGDDIVGQPWDNQFMIMANRTLSVGEETVISFKYKAATAAKSNTQCGGSTPGAYVHWNAIGDVDFTTEEQEFSTDFILKDSECDGMQSITFNLAVIKEANVYEIYDIVWKLKDDTETLIDMDGTKNFFVKTGAGTTPYEFGTDPDGVADVVAKKVASAVTFNLAGQRVADGFKGIVVANGKKAVKK